MKEEISERPRDRGCGEIVSELFIAVNDPTSNIGEALTYLFMHHSRFHTHLMMSTENPSEEEDDQGWYWVDWRFRTRSFFLDRVITLHISIVVSLLQIWECSRGA